MPMNMRWKLKGLDDIILETTMFKLVVSNFLHSQKKHFIEQKQVPFAHHCIVYPYINVFMKLQKISKYENEWDDVLTINELPG